MNLSIHFSMNLLRPATAVFLIVAAAAMAVQAQAPGGEGGGEHHGPPPEALAACKSLAAGQDCSFTTPRGPLAGKCWAPEDRPLACRPNNAPRPGGAVSQSRQ